MTTGAIQIDLAAVTQRVQRFQGLNVGSVLAMPAEALDPSHLMRGARLTRFPVPLLPEPHLVIGLAVLALSHGSFFVRDQ
jgi:hypothetical protein